MKGGMDLFARVYRGKEFPRPSVRPVRGLKDRLVVVVGYGEARNFGQVVERPA